jgi:endo-beta-N-acetylglucosaminidase D
MHSLSWVTLGHSMDAVTGGPCDIATFSGFAIWEKDGHRSLQPFAAHFCTNPASKYAGIQVDAGDVSNVNTKPFDENLALP